MLAEGLDAGQENIVFQIGWIGLPRMNIARWVVGLVAGFMASLTGCTQTVGVEGQMLVMAAPQIDPANPGLARFQSGPAQTKLEVVPESKIVQSLTILQGPQQQSFKLKGVNWGHGSLLLHLTQDQLHGSLQLDWVHDSQPMVRYTSDSCTFVGICAYEVEVEVEQCEIVNNVQTCSKHTETHSEYGNYHACPGYQDVAVTEQYSHALLRLQMKDLAGSQLDFTGQSPSQLFQLERQQIGDCR